MMEVEVEVRQGNDSFLGSNEDVQVVLVETNRGNTTPEMTVINGRDDSTCRGRDGSLDNTRQTINTTFSILNLTKDEDDSDEEEEQSQSLLFEELQSSHPSSPAAVATPDFQIPYFQTVTDSFVDSLCHASSPTCDLSVACCRPTPSNSTSTSEPYSQHAPQDRLQVCVDVWDLLGCASSTASEAYWTTRTVSSKLLQLAVPPTNKAIRVSRQQRRNQLDRWKQQQQLNLIEDVNPTRHGRTTTDSPTSVISKAYTMDDMYHQNNQHHHPSSDHPLAHVIGQGIDPILPDGYDSDPEFFCDTTRQSANASPHSSLMDEEIELMDTRSEDERIHQMVQVRQLQILFYAYTYILQHFLVQSTQTRCSYNDSLSTGNSQFHLDICLASQSSKSKRTHWLQKQTLCRKCLDGTRHCPSPEWNRHRTPTQMERYASTLAVQS